MSMPTSMRAVVAGEEKGKSDDLGFLWMFGAAEKGA